MRLAPLAPALALMASAPDAGAALPRGVHATLEEAQKEARASFLPLVAIFPEDASRHAAALAHLRSLEGALIRSGARIWLAAPGDPEAARTMAEWGIETLPAIAFLEARARKPARYLRGQDCFPFGEALGRFSPFQPPSPDQVEAWCRMDPRPFIAFAAARKADPRAAAREPHRTWLVNLLGAKERRVRDWAATRLVEADAPTRPGDAQEAPFPILLKHLDARFKQEVLQGNHEDGRKDQPPHRDLGATGLLDPDAPVWPVIRRMLANPAQKAFNLPLYTLMAPVLAEADQAWIVRFLQEAPSRGGILSAEEAPLYWIATDWLLVHGRAADWDRFQALMKPLGWEAPIQALRASVASLPGFWDSSAQLQGLFCEGVDPESFWEHPDACLASWGVTREALVELGMEQMKILRSPRVPGYPIAAKSRRLTTTVRLNLMVDATGAVKWLRPQPGYALALFAPVALGYGAGMTFEPARIAGVARPSMFRLYLPFKLR
ncbi:MAG TPA: hypothetical protein VK188_01005 [Holophaga sp.]|nr:hypothetical protein [Holophaga sp.]